MQTPWIQKAAANYNQYLITQRRENDQRLRDEELKRSRENRLAAEGPTVGAQLSANLQAVIKSDVAEFNKEYGSDVLRIRALGNDTFEVRFGEPGEAEKIATLTYVADSTTLSWQVFGGAKGVPLKVGLKTVPQGQGIDELLFTTGQSYPSVEEISQQIISALLPC